MSKPKVNIKQGKLSKLNLNKDQEEKWQSYLNDIKDSYQKNESEEHQKNIFNQFLNNCFGYNINTKNKQDAVIYDKDDKAQVIVEFKAFVNKTEMSTYEDLNRKTLQQILYYYLQETRENKSIKHLVISNGVDFLIWDGVDFEDIFGSDKVLKKEFIDFENKGSIYKTTNQFYKNISSLAINRHLDELQEKVLVLSADCKEDKGIIPLVFSPEYLLKKTIANINQLNKAFYNELLYIMGLEERKGENNKPKIVRLSAVNRQLGSLIENILINEGGG